MKKNLKDFVYEKNLKILKHYIKILKTESNTDIISIPIKFFIILHNYLVLEKMFQEELKVGCGSIMLNEFLHIEWYNNSKEIYETFEKLYDPNHIIRNNMEKFNEIPIISDFLFSGNNYELITKKPISDVDFDADKFGL